MSQNKSEIRALLESANTAPRHRFGQNFMIDQNLVRLIADAASIVRDDVVIEVGPGTGTLTEELLERSDHVIAFEIDRDLAGMLRERLASRTNFTLIEGDALDGKHAVNSTLAEAIAGKPSVKLVANLPYNIASPLIIELLILGVSQLVFTVQKEVAERLKATEKDDAYGPLSVMAGMLSRVELLRTLPPQAFWPPPKIESALVRMTRDDRLGATAPEFSRFVQKVFSFRRKTLRAGLNQMDLDPAKLEALGIDSSLRPERLNADQLVQMFNVFKS